MKKHNTICFILLIITMFSVCNSEGAEEYYLPGQREWTLWDNPRTTNDGNPFVIRPGERVTIVDIQGCGVIRKLWMSMNYVGKALYPRARERNSQVWIECFWDGADQPAISAPIGDFFGHIMGRDLPFENYFFSDPSGRSLQTYIPMPFRKEARIDVINNFDLPISMFHEVRCTMDEDLPEDAGYLHAYYNQLITDEPGQVYTVLPLVEGRGRYLGTHLGIRVKAENGLEWHHGGFSFSVDSDQPNMLTATLDDYCGSSWDYDRVYHHQDSGLLFSEYFPEGGGEHAIYCYHRRDPLYFQESCSVTYRACHGAPVTEFVEWYSTDESRLKAIACDQSLDDIRMFIAEGGGKSSDFVEFFTNDDLYSVAYYYLDRP